MTSSKGHIVLISPVVPTDAVNFDETFEQFEGSGWKLTNQFIDEGPTSIESPADVAACLPGLFSSAHAISSNADAIIVNCMCDPGVVELRDQLPGMLVVGPGEASMHFAAAFGSKFAVLDVTSSEREEVDAQVTENGLQYAYAGHFALEIPVLELSSNHEKTINIAAQQIESAVGRSGAGTILLGCTALAEFLVPLRCELESRQVQCRLVEPVRATIALVIEALTQQIATSSKSDE